MTPNLVSDRSAGASLLGLMGMVSFGFIVLGNLIAAFMIMALYEGDFTTALQDPVAHPDIHALLAASQGVAALVGLVVIPWLYLKLFEQRTLKPFFGPTPGIGWWGILATVVIALGLGISPVSEWNSSIPVSTDDGWFWQFAKEIETSAEKLVKAMTSDLTPATFLLMLVVIAVIPAVGEELVFRGMIQTEMVRAVRNPHLGIWLTAAFFSAFHMQFFGFVPRLLIGAFLGYLYFWSGNLWYPIIAHFFNNGLQLLGIYLGQLKLHSFDMESTDSAPWPYVIVSLLVLGGLLYYCRNNLGLAPNDSDRTQSIQ
jgi:membrane protease YdiL (CAAX protease family)